MYHYKVDMKQFEEKDVYDGDTLHLWIDLGFKIFIKEKIRLAYINAPELRGEEHDLGLKSRNYLRKLLTLAKQSKKDVSIKTLKDRKGKYGRYIGVLYIEDVSINELMLEKGYAKPYVSLKDHYELV